jgi:ABC-type nitrate/sulfonate/bicarbonate transport system ATPase subunit
VDRFLEAERVTIAYPRGGRIVEAVREVSLSLAHREFVALVGPSGCGKTTLLHAIGGLVPIQTGQIRCGGRPVTGPGPERVMVFQEFSLFRWRSVRCNVEFALECNRVPAAQRRPIAERLLKQIGLERHADAYPDQLSGGMKQRVAIARALAYDAAVLLMDEPFGALDAQTRLVMQALLLEIWEGSGKTVLFVTHDIDEAIYLADRILIMGSGPGTIKAEYPVTAPRPRPADFLVSEEFLDLKRRIYGAIRAEDFRKNPAQPIEREAA